MIDKPCETCGTMMYNVRTNRKYCCRQCNKRAESARIHAKTVEKYEKGKVCLKCGKTFVPNIHGWTRRYCFECMPAEIYQDNKGSDFRKQIKKWALEEKGNKCCICGYNICEEALDFHHLNPSQKDFSLSDRNLQLDWTQIKSELDKCILVCSNCHREIHSGLHPEYLKIEGDENEYAK